jgi:hypothetical protein
MHPYINRFVVFGFVVGVSMQSLHADPNALFEQDIKRLKLVDHEPTPSIQGWDGHVIARIEREDRESRFYSFTAASLEPKPLIVPQIDHLISVGTSVGEPVALGRTTDNLIMVRKEGKQWNSIPDLPDLQKSKTPWIIPSTKGIAVLSEKRLFHFNESKWNDPVSLPAVPEFYKEFKPQRWGSKQLLYGSQLFVGWNHGEWGGMVAVFDLNNPKRRWQEVTGKKSVSNLGIVGNDPVTGMTIDAAGNLWISEGSSHLGGMWRGLYRYDGAKWKTLVHGAFDKSEGGLISFPGERTDIIDVSSAPNGKLYVLAGALGIFTYDNEKLAPVVKFDFYSISQGKTEKLDGREIKTAVPCYPDGLVVDGHGNIFVSTHYYGILCFFKADDGYRLRQVIFPHFER